MGNHAGGGEPHAVDMKRPSQIDLYVFTGRACSDLRFPEGRAGAFQQQPRRVFVGRMARRAHLAGPANARPYGADFGKVFCSGFARSRYIQPDEAGKRKWEVETVCRAILHLVFSLAPDHAPYRAVDAQLQPEVVGKGHPAGRRSVYLDAVDGNNISVIDGDILGDHGIAFLAAPVSIVFKHGGRRVRIVELARKGADRAAAHCSQAYVDRLHHISPDAGITILDHPFRRR